MAVREAGVQAAKAILEKSRSNNGGASSAIGIDGAGGAVQDDAEVQVDVDALMQDPDAAKKIQRGGGRGLGRARRGRAVPAQLAVAMPNPLVPPQPYMPPQFAEYMAGLGAAGLAVPPGMMPQMPLPPPPVAYADMAQEHARQLMRMAQRRRRRGR